MKDPRARFQLYAVIVAYNAWGKGPRPLEAWIAGIMREMRKAATIYVENPRYAGKKIIGEQILEALKDADPYALAKKFRGKAERHWKTLRKKCPGNPMSNLDHENLPI